MNTDNRAGQGYRWERHIAFRAFLVVSSLAGMLLASGASMHWW